MSLEWRTIRTLTYPAFFDRRGYVHCKECAKGMGPMECSDARDSLNPGETCDSCRGDFAVEVTDTVVIEHTPCRIF